MKSTLLSKDLVPVNELRANLASWLDHPSKTGRPVVVTQRGKAAAVLVSPTMLDEIEEHGEVVRQVLRGLREVASGEVYEDDEVWADVEALVDGSSSGETAAD